MKSSLVLLSALSGANALLPLIVSGNRFYQVNEDGSKPATNFPIIGVDYQPGGASSFSLSSGTDVLSDGAACKRDAYLMSQLGVNTVRVYAVSPWVNHDECMSVFNEAGIYVMLDVNNPSVSLDRYNPQNSYNSNLLNNIFGIVDAFKNYPNVIAFIAGNEVVNDKKSASVAPPYVRAVQRDLKNYINLHSNRSIPVGYATADDLTLREAMYYYLSCGDDVSKSDFYGINSYQWCSGQSNWQTSGYGVIQKDFSNSSIPVIFTEYGCNAVTPRTFTEVNQGVYGPLNDTVCGGLIYEYSNEANNYGLVNIDSNGNVKLNQDYDNLQKAYAQIKSAPLQLENQTEATIAGPTCSNNTISSDAFNNYDFDASMDLPPCPDEDMLTNGGGNRNVGELVDVSHVSVNYTIQDVDGNTITPDFSYLAAYEINSQTNVPTVHKTSYKATHTTGGSTSSASSAKSTSGSASTSASSASSASSKTKKKNDGTTTMPALSAVMALIFSFF